MSRRKFSRNEVLCYSDEPKSRGTVLRYFKDLRVEDGRPLRCDNEKCDFYAKPLIWNGAPLTPILDHINGVNNDNGANNLRFLCPNCNSQLPTHAGGNRGRVKNRGAKGYDLMNKDGTKATHRILKEDKLAITSDPPKAIVKKGTGNH